jgi:outer membrane lipoprotein-sorting protein
VAAIVAGTTIAIAAVGSGPVPPAKPLPAAIRQALAAPAVAGITARISFTNHLIDSSNVQGLDPLLLGGSGRLWYSPDRGLRIELQADVGDAQLVVDRGVFWAYDPLSNTVYEGRLPAMSGAASDHARDRGGHSLPSVADIESFITHISTYVTVSGAIPGDIAGRPAYSVRVSPRGSGGLLSSVVLGWDAVRGVPLRFAVYARGDGSPVLELTATDISYGRVPASVFAISPPSGAHVVQLPLGMLAGAGRPTLKRAHHHDVAGLGPVAARVRFPLAAPASLAGLSRTSVGLLGRDSALVVYGQGLGGIYVIEQPASRSSARAPAGAGPDQPGLHLPSVTIDGAPAMELATPLGTVLRFTRAGVSYTVLGSVTRATAELAARSL